MWILLLAFVGVPLVEIALFIKVGGLIGLSPTLVIVIATAIVGTALMRHQGLHVLGQVQASLNRGEMPVEQIFIGACLLVAGAFLLTPGFFTDTIGFLLFVPLVRQWAGRLLLGALAKRGAQGSWHGKFNNGRTVIDAEFKELTPDDDADDDEGPQRLDRRHTEREPK